MTKTERYPDSITRTMMDSRSPAPLRVCATADVAPGSVKRVDVPGLPPLAVFNLGGTFYVTDDTCTHGQASLSEGYVEGEEIECPWHGGRFCIATGAPKSLPAVEPIQTYAVTVDGGDVCITPPESAS